MKDMWRVVGLCLLSLPANAALQSRMSGQAYYDDVLNITWLADANLADTTTFGVLGINANGSMTWAQANEWITAMNTAAYLGTSDWRLSSADVNRDGNTFLGPVDCSTATEPDCRDYEMGYMYWQNLIRAVSPGPFSNLQPDGYWSGSEQPPFIDSVSTFSFASGENIVRFKVSENYSWAVRSGDIGRYPVPGAVWLFGSALGVMGVLRRKLAG